MPIFTVEKSTHSSPLDGSMWQPIATAVSMVAVDALSTVSMSNFAATVATVAYDETPVTADGSRLLLLER